MQGAALLLCSMIVSGSLSAAEPAVKEPLTWAVVHWPPIMILEGKDKGLGRYDIYLKLFQKHMPMYEHSNREMNWKRIWSGIKKGHKICNLLAFKSAERELTTEFSIPSFITLPNRIILKKSRLESLGSPESISIVELMHNPALSGVLQSARSYSPILDQLLDKHEQDSNISRSLVDAEHLIKMLLRRLGRFDYLIEYPYIANYLTKKQQSQPQVELRSVRIEEMETFSVSYLACPKNSWGKQVIADFNRTVTKLKHTSKYQSIMETWHDDPLEIKVIREGYRQLLELNK